MVSTVYIERSERQNNSHLIQEIVEATYGNNQKIDFIEEFVPQERRVPEPKVSEFKSFLMTGAKLLWAVKYNEKTVGFILVVDMLHNNSIGFGINVEYSNKGICSQAFDQVINSPSINFPLYGVTSKRNSGAKRLMRKVGFLETGERLFFFGEESLIYKFLEGDDIS